MEVKRYLLFVTVLVGGVHAALPKVGLYRGASSPGNYLEFETWLGGTNVEYGLQSIGWDSWNALLYPQWLLAWVNSVPADQNRTFVLSIPMVVDGSTLEQGAAGNFNSTYLALANLLKQYNLTGSIHGAPKTILRFGWEFDGTYFPWHVSAGQETVYIQLWQTMTQIFRSVDPTFQTMWNGQVIYNTLSPFQFWPGDTYVSYVAIDIYDSYYLSVYPYQPESNERGTWDATFSYALNDTVEYAGALYRSLINNTNSNPSTATTRWTLAATAATMLSGRTTAWNTYFNNTDARFIDLTKWSTFARQHSKPMVIQEWATVTGVHGGGDDTFYVQKMIDWMSDPINNVVYQSWFLEEIAGGISIYEIFPENGTAIQMKNASALYHQTWYATLPSTTGSASTSGASLTTRAASTSAASTTKSQSITSAHSTTGVQATTGDMSTTRATPTTGTSSSTTRANPTTGASTTAGNPSTTRGSSTTGGSTTRAMTTNGSTTMKVISGTPSTTGASPSTTSPMGIATSASISTTDVVATSGSQATTSPATSSSESTSSATTSPRITTSTTSKPTNGTSTSSSSVPAIVQEVISSASTLVSSAFLLYILLLVV